MHGIFLLTHYCWLNLIQRGTFVKFFRYALGSPKVDEKNFSSIEEMVAFHKNEELILHSDGVQTGSTRLTDSPPKWL